MTTIGLISDTHGLLRPEARLALRGVDRILHAGDICNAEVLAALAEIAPVTAVRGNNDRGAWAESVPERALIDVEGVKLYVLHDLHELDIDPRAT
ncbi:MAG: metallophosphoesterase family protein, partial [Bacillota bacterium]